MRACFAFAGCVATVTLLASVPAAAVPTSDHATRRAATASRESVVARLEQAYALERRGRMLAALSLLRPTLAQLELTGAASDLLVATRHHVEELERALPRITLCGVVPADAVVLVDGTRRESRALLLDPGDHEVTVDVRGRARWRAAFRVDAGDAREVGIQAGVPLGFDDVPTPTPHDADERVETSPYQARSRSAQVPLARFRLVFPSLSPRAQVDAPPATGGALVPPGEAGPARTDERIDKKLFGQVVAGTGFNVSSHGGMVMVTTSAEGVLPNARLGAALNSSGTVFALTGRW
jgi:hypothetical protein